jgi:hypothetical protein
MALALVIASIVGFGGGVVAEMPPLRLVKAPHGCFVAVHGSVRSEPVCRAKPLVVFVFRDREMTKIVGLVSPDVASLVMRWRTPSGVMTQGGTGLLLSTGGPLRAFGMGVTGPPTVIARDRANRPLATAYCASPLRGVCGMSAQRRS